MFRESKLIAHAFRFELLADQISDIMKIGYLTVVSISG